ncbi:MAG: RNase adapter RapZ [Gammaproteobacteria bacterium]|nr:MAG: RNase adapter RapZ [Pseudomonadota bacterium]PIE38198.1 MAG: RNase adapter RapZ [Gammaproteobacteria bacterium]
MKLIIVSGRSGSGKSTALHVLEDVGYYCIDNLPIGLLIPLTEQALVGDTRRLNKIAVSIDARNLSNDISSFDSIYQQLLDSQVEVEMIYLDAQSTTLLKRFHATRRKHPLSSDLLSLREAIEAEIGLLSPLSRLADLNIDTSNLGMYELRNAIKERVVGHKYQELSLLFQSFGFKNGTPGDADFVFDVRCLPNPYWDHSLRKFNGNQQPVIDFLSAQEDSGRMLQDIADFLTSWVPKFQDSNRTYMTIAIGCTGGQHRSVYICEQLVKKFRSLHNNVQIRHRELPTPDSQEQEMNETG